MISVSSITSYMYCPRKLFLTKILKVKEPEKKELVFGKISHKIFDFINKKEEFIVKNIKEDMNLESIKNLYLKIYKEVLKDIIKKEEKKIKDFNINEEEIFENILKTIEEEAKIRSENVFKFIKKHKIFGEKLWQELEPKIKTEVEIYSKSLDLKGIIDRVEIYKDKCIPYELKTGNLLRDDIWPSHKIQLCAYALMLEKEYNLKIKEGFIIYLNNNKKVKILFNPFLREDVLSLVEKVKDVLNSKEIPPITKNKNKCKKCGLKEICYDEEKIKDLLNKNFIKRSF